MRPHDRLKAFMAWRGWKQPQMAEAVGVAQATISKLIHGRPNRGPGTPGVAIAVAIERVTSAVGPDGTTWPGGPIRVEDWAESAPAASGEPEAA